MIISKASVIFFLAAKACCSVAIGECTSPEEIICKKVESAPTLDGDLSDWADIDISSLPMTTALGHVQYAHGNMSVQCAYDDEQIHFGIAVRGNYRFNSSDDHLCAAISTMMKMGDDAEFVHMGGCPQAMSGCPDGIPDSCSSYTVDVGAHWELKTTEQGVNYNMTETSGTGNDPDWNKDDEVAVSSYCRVDDDGPNAGNEWAGAWVHNVDTSDPTTFTSVDGTPGTYVFEMSRNLLTASTTTDAQLEDGKTYSFGLAFWDPFETDANGWTKAGHFVTGCSKDWISLVLGEQVKAKQLTSRAVLANSAAGAIMTGLATSVVAFDLV